MIDPAAAVHPSMIDSITGLVTALASLTLQIGVVIGVILTYRLSKKNRDEIQKNTAITIQNAAEGKKRYIETAQQTTGQLAQIHTLVNDISTKAIGRIADKSEEIADLTGTEEDRAEAVSDREDHARKVAADERANSPAALAPAISLPK